MTTARPPRRLRLHQETLRLLSRAALDAAQGGGPPIPNSFTISIICCDSKSAKP